MSLETLIGDLVTALKENTAAHNKFTDIAVDAAKASKASKAAPAADETPEEKPAAKKPAAKKPAAKKPAAKKPEAPELVTETDFDATKAKALEYMGTDDEEERTARQKNFRGALDHLGIKKLLPDNDPVEWAKLTNYINFWLAGLTPDFDEIDAKVDEAAPESDEDDMVG